MQKLIYVASITKLLHAYTQILSLSFQEQKELQHYQQIDMWDFVMEMNHCLRAVGILLEGKNGKGDLAFS